MHGSYKILYLVPSFLHESRYAIGAVLRTEAGTRFVPALRMPSRETLGDEGTERLLAVVVQRAASLATLDEREAMRLLGQHIAFGAVRQLEFAAADFAPWLQASILPHS